MTLSSWPVTRFVTGHLPVSGQLNAWPARSTLKKAFAALTTGVRLFVVEVNGKPKLSASTLERAKLLAQSYLRDKNIVRIRSHDATGEPIAYFYDPLAVAWVKSEIQ